MARIYYRPSSGVTYGGEVERSGSGNIFGDNNTSTGAGFGENSGVVLVYSGVNPVSIPAGKNILAVCVGQSYYQSKSSYWDGWPAAYLRINNVRIPSSYLYSQDSGSGNREQIGPAVYKTGQTFWLIEDINTMSSDHASPVGTTAPKTGMFWSFVNDGFIILITNEDVPVPSAPYPASGQTINSSSVNFSAVIPAPQAEQPVRAIFQVAKDSGFTQEVKTFGGTLNTSTLAGSKSVFTSVKNSSTYTNLGPGTWYLRMKGRDYLGTESSWGATTTFTIQHPALPVPALVSPSGVSTNPYSVRTASIAADPSGDRKVGIEFQFSKQSDFTGEVIIWTNKQGLWNAGNISYDPTPRGDIPAGVGGYYVSSGDQNQRLKQGSWYARVRSVDDWSQVSDWSSNFTFTVSHLPIATDFSPSLGVAFDQVNTPVRWKFTDPWSGDIQTAYRLRVWDLSDNLLQDTGKVIFPSSAATMSIGGGHLQEQLKYNIEIWDIDDAKSSAQDTQSFFMSVSPVINLINPSENESIPSGQPNINWSVTYARGDVVQKNYRVIYARADSNTVVFDSGIVTSTATTYTPPRPILLNNTSYQVYLIITDSDNLSNVLVRTFSTNFIRPAQLDSFADTSSVEELGYVLVEWTGDIDLFFAEYRIYRKKPTDTDWSLAGTVGDPAAHTFHDWTVGGGVYIYIVVQAAYRYGSLVESDAGEFLLEVDVISSNYWLLIPDDESRNIKLYSVVGDKLTQLKQINKYNIIGGGTKVNQGPRIGKEGSLSCTVRPSWNRTASEQLEILNQLDLDYGWVLMKDPFGNVTKISIGEVSLTRIAGTGTDELADIEIPYFEVK